MTALTSTLKIGEAISGFANTSIWLIVGAFLFSRGFIKTGLGKRIAYNLISAFGSSSLRLAYALAFQSFGIGITWGDWAMAAIVPGIIALIIMPYFIYKVYLYFTCYRRSNLGRC